MVRERVLRKVPYRLERDKQLKQQQAQSKPVSDNKATTAVVVVVAPPVEFQQDVGDGDVDNNNADVPVNQKPEMVENILSLQQPTIEIVKAKQPLQQQMIKIVEAEQPLQQQMIDLVEAEQDEQVLERTPVEAAPHPAPRGRHAVVPHKVTYNEAYRRNNVVENLARYDAGQLNQDCQFCGALHYEKEKADRLGQRRLCCNKGEIDLPPLRSCPPLLRAYLTNDNAEARSFRTNIRSINSLFAMASFKTSMPQNVQGQGHWCFSVCQIYHYTEALPRTQELRQPVLNQYYFVDAEQAIDRRADFLADRLVSREIIERIEMMLRAENPFVISYQTMKEVIAEMRAQGHDVDEMILGFTEDIGRNLRNYNLPESRSDIAAVFCGGKPPFNVDLKIYPKNVNADRELKNLNIMSDPMVYPILFPKGEYGYDTQLKYRTRRTKTITIREFYRHRIEVRRN
ncbi:unnamed protein product [Brassicogethes aeneus]|uniref:Helitron helicase-like domain-containing protein n=1 Tax=Brassicogethes aeneus TaxID=1431903 RepID=A0A9P0FNT1_BRAAE|nr:unnamed protein product [Brassicogethes aeneus]